MANSKDFTFQVTKQETKEISYKISKNKYIIFQKIYNLNENSCFETLTCNRIKCSASQTIL